MITLDAYHTYTLEQDDLRKLEELLATKFQNLESFYKESDGEGDIVLLIDGGYSTCAVVVDWRWDAAELFAQLQNLVPEHSINLTEASYDKDKERYELSFTADDKQEKLTVPL